MGVNLNMYWPLCLVVLANVLYNIASKSIPVSASPWAVLVITYLVSSCLSLIAFFIFEEDRNFLGSVQKLDWTGFGLGLSLVCLEIGYIFIYRTGWKLSVASLLANILLAVILMLFGVLIYKEHLNAWQFAGIALCLTGCALLISQR